MTLIDLSVTLDNDKIWAPWRARNKVIRQSHAFGRGREQWTDGNSLPCPGVASKRSRIAIRSRRRSRCPMLLWRA